MSPTPIITAAPESAIRGAGESASGAFGLRPKLQPLQPSRNAGSDARTRKSLEMNFNFTTLECETQAYEQPSLGIVRPHHGDVGSGIYHADPESRTCSPMPSSIGFSVDIYARHIDEPQCAHVERKDERELRDRHPQLGGAEQRRVACVTLLVLCSQGPGSSDESCVEVGKVAEELLTPGPKRQDGVGENRESQERMRHCGEILIHVFRVPDTRIHARAQVECAPERWRHTSREGYSAPRASRVRCVARVVVELEHRARLAEFSEAVWTLLRDEPVCCAVGIGITHDWSERDFTPPTQGVGGRGME